jgi:hypothetical protein
MAAQRLRGMSRASAASHSRSAGPYRTRRGDALFELGDAVLCRQDRVQMLAELSLEPEHQRGHGALI